MYHPNSMAKELVAAYKLDTPTSILSTD